jgi:CcmD family protein
MVLVTRIARTLALALLLVGGASITNAQPAQTPDAPMTTAAQEEYVPIDQLPESEKLPAAPFLIAAYVVVWAALLVYVLSLWRRLGRVEADLRDARRTSGAR